MRLVLTVLLICLAAADIGDRLASGAMSDVAHGEVAEQLQRHPGSSSNSEAPQSGAGSPTRAVRVAQGEEAKPHAPAEQAEKAAEDQNAGGPEKKLSPELGPQQEHEGFLGRVAGAFLHWLDLHGNAVVAIFTVVLTAASIFQGFATWKSVQASRVAARAAEGSADAATRTADMLLTQEAPLLVLNTASRIDHLVVDGVTLKSHPATELQMRITNFGRSPALCLSHTIFVALGGEMTAFSANRFEGGMRVVTPLGGETITWVDLGRRTTEDERVALFAGESQLLLLWTVVYRDAFGESRKASEYFAFDRQSYRFERQLDAIEVATPNA